MFRLLAGIVSIVLFFPTSAAAVAPGSGSGTIYQILTTVATSGKPVMRVIVNSPNNSGCANYSSAMFMIDLSSDSGKATANLVQLVYALGQSITIYGTGYCTLGFVHTDTTYIGEDALVAFVQ